MATTAQLSKSLDLSAPKAALASGVSANYSRYRSGNASYTAGDIISIAIPCGGSTNEFLLPSESYLELQMTSTLSTTAGGMRLDNSAYSLFQSVRIFHGSNLLVEQNHCGRLWNALLDHASRGSRGSSGIAMGCHYQSPLDGHVLTTGGVYKYCIPLPVALLGTLTSSAVPLGYMGASDLRIELQLVPNALQAFTTCQTVIGAVTPEDSTGVNTTNDPTASFVVDQVFYNAKVAKLSSDINQSLIASFGDRPISLPSTDYSIEQSHMAAGVSSHSMNINAQYSSLKSIMFYAVNQALSLGQVANYNTGRAISSRFAGGDLTGFWLNINGDTVPSHRNQAVSALGATLPSAGTVAQDFHSAIPFASLMRCWNEIGVGEAEVAGKLSYAASVSTAAGQRAVVGRFLTGVDLL